MGQYLHRLIRVHGRGNPAEVPAMKDHTHSQARTTATPGAPAIVTGSGHVYPSPRQGLTIYRDRSVANESQKRQDFQAFQERGQTGGREGVCIQKNSIRHRRPWFSKTFTLSRRSLNDRFDLGNRGPQVAEGLGIVDASLGQHPAGIEGVQKPLASGRVDLVDLLERLWPRRAAPSFGTGRADASRCCTSGMRT